MREVHIAHRREYFLSFYDKLAVQPAQRALDISRHAQDTETGRQHIRGFTNYHLLVTNLPKEYVETQHRTIAYTTLCLEHRQR